MKEIKFTVTDPLGIHARPAGILVKEAKKYGSKITVQVEGDDEADCAAAIEKFLKENF